MSWLAGFHTRLRLLLARRAAEARMDEEIALHIEMETGRLVREQGLSPDQARRQALAAFGGIERHKEELRDGRGLAWLGGMRLDFRLGLRMLVKYPGLTLVSVVGMAFGVAIGAAGFGIIYAILDPALPLDEGDRVVSIWSDDPTKDDAAGKRTHLHDLATWREALTAVEELGAFRTVDRNLITGTGRPGVVRIAEMTASGFRVARVPPLLGRYLLASDEERGAPPVAVIGYDMWQRRFAGDSGILGWTLQLGATQHTIVGVMPSGFGFPINNRIWTPLRLDPLDYERGEAPVIEVFGRLAPTATLQQARTQATTIAARMAAEHPATHETIRTYIAPYGLALLDDPRNAWIFHLVQVLISMVLVLVGTNVAILVYARNATRAGEIAVRTALGASRRRIVAQLFVEALVLATAAAAVGLVFASSALRQLEAALRSMGGEQIPFWLHLGLSPGVVLYAAGLAILAAVIVGVLPALKATRRRVHAGLQQLGTGGSGMRLGRIWTVLIVAQVAVTMAILPVTVHVITSLIGERTTSTFDTRGLLAASLRLDREDAGTDDFGAYDAEEFRARYAQRQVELVRRLESEPGVEDVLLMGAVEDALFMSGLPGDGRPVRVETDGARVAPGTDSGATAVPVQHRVELERVDVGYFGMFDLPILAGRPFGTADMSPAAHAVIVSRSVAQELLGGGNVLGRHIRLAVPAEQGRSESARDEPWYEIVGIVADIPGASNAPDPRALAARTRIYLPLLPGDEHPMRLVVRVNAGDPMSFAGRLQELTLALDPMLRLVGISALGAVNDDEERLKRLGVLAASGLVLSVLLLSAGGVYALMSFTVTRRRREIGIRAALGAGQRHVIGSVLARAVGQIAIGIVVGVGMAALLDRLTGGEMMGGRSALLLPAVAALMAVVGLAAATGPARRALRIQPTEALRAE